MWPFFLRVYFKNGLGQHWLFLKATRDMTLKNTLLLLVMVRISQMWCLTGVFLHQLIATTQRLYWVIALYLKKIVVVRRDNFMHLKLQQIILKKITVVRFLLSQDKWLFEGSLRVYLIVSLSKKTFYSESFLIGKHSGNRRKLLLNCVKKREFNLKTQCLFCIHVQTANRISRRECIYAPRVICSPWHIMNTW